MNGSNETVLVMCTCECQALCEKWWATNKESKNNPNQHENQQLNLASCKRCMEKSVKSNSRDSIKRVHVKCNNIFHGWKQRVPVDEQSRLNTWDFPIRILTLSPSLCNSMCIWCNRGLTCTRRHTMSLFYFFLSSLLLLLLKLELTKVTWCFLFSHFVPFKIQISQVEAEKTRLHMFQYSCCCTFFFLSVRSLPYPWATSWSIYTNTHTHTVEKRYFCRHNYTILQLSAWCTLQWAVCVQLFYAPNNRAQTESRKVKNEEEKSVWTRTRTRITAIRGKKQN